MSEEQKMQIAQILKDLRISNNLSQTKLAKEINKKVINFMDGDNGKQTISKLENGRNGLTPPLAIAYADYFNISLDEIYGRIEIQKTKKEDISDIVETKKDFKEYFSTSTKTDRFSQLLDNSLKSILKKEDDSNANFRHLLNK